MTGYRLYTFDGANRIIGVHEIEATNDADALSQARRIKSGIKLELWQRERLIARFENSGSN